MRTVGLGSGVHAFMIAHQTGTKARAKSPRPSRGSLGAHLAIVRTEAIDGRGSRRVFGCGDQRAGRAATWRAPAEQQWRPGNGKAGWSSSTWTPASAVRSPRETTQPNRTDTVYWATGLTPVYLEGALQRALHPTVLARPRTQATRRSTSPRPISPEPPVPDSILNPFSVYRKGEALLRRQLGAFSVWHLVNIVRDHELSDLSAATLNAMRADDLVEADRRRGPTVRRGGGAKPGSQATWCRR